MPKRLAITISGAVSLGSYEAGVLYEVMTAIGKHNADPATIADDADRIEIDVLTGASAGGMTAVIATQNLLYARDSLKAPDNNPFYNPWVADISLDGLLKPDAKTDPAYPDIPTPEDSTHSVFSSNLIEKLARKYITHRYQSGSPTSRAPHPAAAKQIRLGLALSNLNGVPYSYPLRVTQPGGEASFAYARFQDEMTGLFTADGSDGKDVAKAWEPWREAAVSCGAFPFAFRVKQLQRFETEYTRHHRDDWPNPERDFVYTDGGIFQNEPLGLAKNLVNFVDRPPDGSAADYQNADTRFYLYVAPGAKTSDANDSFTAAKAQFLPTAMTIVGAVLHQAKFQDCVNAEKINDQIYVFNLRADQLFNALLEKKIDPKALQAAADVLLPGLFATEPPPPPPRTREDTEDEARARLRKQFTKESTALLAISAETEKAWIDSILVLETAAELNFKDEMYIYGITATNQELAGGGMFAFEGFFDLILRQHDYNLGRQKAREFLAQHRHRGPERVAGSPEPPPDIGPIRYDPTDKISTVSVPERDPRTGDVLIAKLDSGVRQRLLETASQRAGEIINEILTGLNVNKFLAIPLRWALTPIIKGQLKKRLAL
jgi:hypothetical protein